MDPWQRFSASAGMSVYEPKDRSVDQVQERADQEMYAKKEQFKKQHSERF